jgi:uncharacterized protein (TIGR03067 family)
MLMPLQPLIILLAFLAPPAPDDADLFKGSWKVTTLDTPEQKSKSEDLKDVEVVFEGDKYRQTQGAVLEEGTFKLMPDKNPRAIDFAIKSGPDKGKDQLGIYQFDGDTLKICVAKAGSKTRPTDFALDSGSDRLLMVLKKAKK